MEHLTLCTANNMLGSVDANRGDMLLGWDTDQFPTNIYDATLAMYVIVKSGGFTTGGLNFDAKVRRQSIDPADLFHGHIGGMDAFARGLKIAAKMLEDGIFEDLIKERYAGWDSKFGRTIENGQSSLNDMETHILKNGEPQIQSGRQEMFENILNEYIR